MKRLRKVEVVEVNEKDGYVTVRVSEDFNIINNVNVKLEATRTSFCSVNDKWDEVLGKRLAEDLATRDIIAQEMDAVETVLTATVCELEKDLDILSESDKKIRKHSYKLRSKVQPMNTEYDKNINKKD